MSDIRWLAIALGLPLTLLASAQSIPSALANHVAEQSLQNRLQQSDLVVVGHVEAIQTVSGHGVVDKIAIAKTITVVKGKPQSKVEFYITSDIAEFQLDCCVVGKRYLLFLEKAGSGRYEVVNSRFGAYPLEDGKVQ